MNCPCDQTLKPILDKTKKLSLINAFDQFCHISPQPKHDSFALNITLERNKVIINHKHTFSFQQEYDLKEIAQCVFQATRTKRFSNFFTDVEVDINFGEEPNDTDALVQHLDINLHKSLPTRIFAHTQIKYHYLVES
jgi:hypothetical protein